MDAQQRIIVEQRLEKLRDDLADLQSRWPAHSVKTDMLIQLENLEEEIEKLQAELKLK